MRTQLIALAIACFATAADAANGDISTGAGNVVPIPIPVPSVPASARRQAEAAVVKAASEPGAVTFRAIHAVEAKAIRHDPFAPAVDGPVAVICGQFSPSDRASEGGYQWFLVAIKEERVLWTTLDVPGAYAEAYNSCRAAGLTDATAHTGSFR